MQTSTPVYVTPGYEQLELSTQLVIREALNRGYDVDVLDPQDNFIRIVGSDRVEYLKQATRTGADTYISPLIMENKLVSKLLLSEAGLRVPAGEAFDSAQQLRGSYPRWNRSGLVVKPNSTNFGLGVSVFPDGATETQFGAAGDAVFHYDRTALVEEFVPGREYRFLVIGDYVRAVLHRIPANVVGDGRHTIAELVEIKNASPLRMTGYVSPLERVRLGETELAYLADRERTTSDVVAPGEVVYLRENSNISTGGDSIDFTDDVHPGYRDLAVAAAAAVGARICGVDLVTSSITDQPTGTDYAVIEVNFNPALHIHDYPATGVNRMVERHVLDLLDL